MNARTIVPFGTRSRNDDHSWLKAPSRTFLTFFHVPTRRSSRWITTCFRGCRRQSTPEPPTQTVYLPGAGCVSETKIDDRTTISALAAPSQTARNVEFLRGQYVVVQLPPACVTPPATARKN